MWKQCSLRNELSGGKLKNRFQMEEMNMCRELTLIEKLDVEFEEREGLFYPLVDSAGSDTLVDGSAGNAKTKDIGKYGHLWINFMKEAYPERYRSLVRFGLLEEKAVAVKEEAYELLCGMEEKLLEESDTGKSFAEIYALRTQVRMLVEEIVLREVVNVFH